MKIVVAGEEKNYEEGINMTKLIELEKVEAPEYVTVSINDEFYDRKDFESYQLQEGDQVEFLYFMGGGR